MKNADAVAFEQHCRNCRSVERNGLQSQLRARLFCWIEGVDEIKTLADTCQHAEREHIDLHEPQSINIVLVPFNEGAVLHRCIVNGYSLVPPVLCQHKSAHMLRQMAREVEKLAATPREWGHRSEELRVGKKWGKK